MTSRIKTRHRFRPPHAGVSVRLGVSKIHGVGVFAIKKIKKGQLVFEGDDGDLVWVRKGAVSRLSPTVRQLYEDFCVEKEGKYGCPKNFDLLTVAWYLNHSTRPNVRSDDEYRFFAIRDINPGEELTADYRTYSEGPHP